MDHRGRDDPGIVSSCTRRWPALETSMPRLADWLSPPSSHCSVVRSEEFDEHGMARGRSEACIAGDQWRPESLGKPDVSSIVGREIVTELPNSRQERKMGVASDAEVQEILERLVGTRCCDCALCQQTP